MNQIAKRLKQYLGKASFSCEVDKFSAFGCLEEITNEIERLGAGWKKANHDLFLLQQELAAPKAEDKG